MSTRFDENEEMVNMLNNFKGSLENKIRQAYNSGFTDGFVAGANEAIEDMKHALDRNLRENFQHLMQIEPKGEINERSSSQTDR